MAIAEDASAPAAVTSTGANVTSASFTPAASSLILAVVSAGNTSGVGTPTLTVSDSLSGSWTLLKDAADTVNGSGRAAVYVQDAGSSPSARTVTITASGGTQFVGTALCVKVLTGARPAASCLGATAILNTGTAYTISITTTTAGSLACGGLVDIINSGTLTLNGITSSWQAVSDTTNTEKYAAFRAASLTGTPGATTLGYTNTAGDNQSIVATEILAVAGPSVTTTSLPEAVTGQAYSATVTASGGTTPYTWSISSGSLPGWASLNTSTGAITGTPSGSAAWTSFTVEVTDAASLTATRALGIGVLVPGSLVSAEPAVAIPGLFSPGRLAVSGPSAGADTAHAADGAQIRVSKGDTASGAEGFRIKVSGADTGHGSEAVTRAGPLGADTGHAAEAGSVHAALSGSDTGHAAEAFTVRVSSADTGHAAEASSLHVTLSRADTGHAAEGGLVIRVTGADTGHGSEASSIHAALSGADTASGAEGFRVKVSSADTGHAAEAGLAGHAALGGAETGHATEGTPRIQPPAGPDTGHGSEASSIHATLSSADTGHAAENGSVPGSPAGADTGHGSEAGSVHAALSAADTAHGADAPGSFWRSDSGHGSEGTPSIRVAGAEAGQGAESGSVHAAVPGADTGHATEGPRVIRVSSADTGHGSEAASIHATASGADTGHGTEASSVHATLSSADSGSAAEAGAANANHLVNSADSAQVVESAFYFRSSADTVSAAEGLEQLRVRGSDTARAGDRPLNAWPSSRDSGSGGDRPLSALRDGFDSSLAREAYGRFAFAHADTASVSDQVYDIGIWTYLPVAMRFGLDGRWIIAGRDADGTEVIVHTAARLDGALLELAARVSDGTHVHRVTSADCGAAGEAVTSRQTGVTVWVVPAVTVSCWAEEAR